MTKCIINNCTDLINCLLVVYILLGSGAFRAERKSTRLWSMGAAVLVFGFIITVARAHDPLGIFSTI
jgi:uncharacterized membrane protein SirB2